MKTATTAGALAVFLPLAFAAGAHAALPITHAALRVTVAPSVTLTAATEKAGTGTRGIVSPDGRTLSFRQRRIQVTATSGPASDMLSYRIAGLRNPTLVVPEGATLTVRFINTDDDMAHNLRFGTQHVAAASSSGTPDLAHRTGQSFRAADVTLHLPSGPGTYYYFCTVPGHALGGMWGKVSVH